MAVPTKVTITLASGALKTYWATDVPVISTDGKRKTFTGKRDGESQNGAITLHIGTYVDQKEEPGTP